MSEKKFLFFYKNNSFHGCTKMVYLQN